MEPGHIIKPNLSEDSAVKLIQEHFELNVLEIKQLNSYDDLNFLIKGENGKGEVERYTFKVMNSMDSKNTELIQAQNFLIIFLSEKGFYCPVPLKNKSGELLSVVILEGGSTHIIRLLSFLHGEIFYDVKESKNLFIEAGVFLAKMQEAFKEIEDNIHKKVLEDRNFIWMLANFPDIEKFTFAVANKPESHNLIMEVLEEFKKNVVPKYPLLEKGVVHGDFNDANIIVKLKGGNENNEYEIHGIIDFGDSQSSYYIFDLGLSMAYLMLECAKETSDIDPFEAGRLIISGYEKIRKIPDIEWEIIRTVIAARLSQSLVMGAYSYSLDTSNEYLLTTAKYGWTFFHQLWTKDAEELLSILKSKE